MAVVGLIPARAGSKGIPGKNLALLGDKPLLAWTIEAAMASRVIDTIVVSSDDSGILNAAAKHGAVPLNRPPELARDESQMMPVVAHAVAALESQGNIIDTLVLLQPTSPLRAAEDVANCVQLHRRTGRTIVSVRTVKISPAWMFAMDANGVLSPLAKGEVVHRRQDLPSLVAPNGAVYVMAVSAIAGESSFFENALGYEMPAERSIDIDEPFDLAIAQLLVAGKRKLRSSE